MSKKSLHSNKILTASKKLESPEFLEREEKKNKINERERGGRGRGRGRGGVEAQRGVCIDWLNTTSKARRPQDKLPSWKFCTNLQLLEDLLNVAITTLRCPKKVSMRHKREKMNGIKCRCGLPSTTEDATDLPQNKNKDNTTQDSITQDSMTHLRYLHVSFPGCPLEYGLLVVRKTFRNKVWCLDCKRLFTLHWEHKHW